MIVMRNIEIITNILNSYTGIENFVINKLNCDKYNGQPYHIYFQNGSNFKFLIKDNEDFNILVKSIYDRYLVESQEYGMNTP